jgi:N utilization substance protein A
MTTPAEIITALRELANTKQLDREELVDLLRDGIHAALVKRYGPNVRAEIEVDDLKGTIHTTVLKDVVEDVEDPSSQVALQDAQWEDPEFQVGDVLEEEVPFEAFGRLAVQAAKQRIIQRVREGERARIREEFGPQVSELVSGEVQQIERGRLVIMLNKFREAEAIIPYREQNPREHFHQGDPIRAVLKRLEETPKGPRLILSRADPHFVQALFKLEVPEIQQAIVEIRASAREVASRTKIAVVSRDDSIDPVGACVGMKGSRVQAVVNELGGERIDIVPWSPDPERFAKLALAPARVSRVFSDPESKTIQAIVDEDQLSLAIGRNGQNVRLASELTGWKIDLYSSREWLERGGEGPLFAPLEPEDELVADVLLNELKGMPLDLVETLEATGKKSLRDILDLERDDVLKIEGITGDQADFLMAFLTELTEENVEAEAEAAKEKEEASSEDSEPEATPMAAEAEAAAKEKEEVSSEDSEPEATPMAAEAEAAAKEKEEVSSEDSEPEATLAARRARPGGGGRRSQSPHGRQGSATRQGYGC